MTNSWLHVGFTGTQKGMTNVQAYALRSILANLQPAFGHHGCCVGADERFHMIARNEFGVQMIGHPPVNESKMMRVRADEFHYLNKALQYIPRNHMIVRESKIMIATPYEDQE